LRSPPLPVKLAPMIRLLVLTVLLASSAAQAQDEPTAVSPVTVMPKTNPPKVASSYPAEGQVIAPGVLILKIAFDQKMTPKGWSYAAAPDGADKPDCVATPRLLKDDKTFVLLCRVVSGKTYKVALNTGGASTQGQGRFANQAENPAEAHVLSFQVVKGEPVTTVPRAMLAAGLKADETPIEDDPARAAVQAAQANIVTR
jgi:hypothetical protein